MATLANVDNRPVDCAVDLPDGASERGELGGKEVTVVGEEKWYEKAGRVALKVLKIALQVIIGVALFICNSSFFAVGFVVGLIFNNRVQVMVDKIKLVWEKQPWIVVIVLGVGAFLALPITLATTALLYGAYLGAKLTNYAEEQARREREEAPHLEEVVVL